MRDVDQLLRHLSRLWVLHSRTGHPANLCVLDGVDVAVIATAAGQEGDQGVGGDVRFPAYCTASGMVLLSALHPRERNALVGQMIFEKRGPRTVGSESELLARLRYLGENGSCVGVNEEESGPGEFAVACPVHSADGTVVAALSQSARASEVSWEEFIERVFIALTDEAACISSLLGYECDVLADGLSPTVVDSF